MPWVGMGRGSFPKFPIANFPEISERKIRYLSGIIPFFIIMYISILEVCLIRPALAGNAGYFISLEEEGASGILCYIDYKTLTTKKYIPFDYGRKYMRFLNLRSRVLSL